ncbi:MAG: glycerol-3-phosphate acyltransferase [Zavarzinella sp.]
MHVAWWYWPLCYLCGAVPFAWIIARAKGVNLFQVGSGNIGATNLGRTLGRKYGILCFLLDFLKGAVPVGIASLFAVADRTVWGIPQLLNVGAAVATFAGHLFPIYLRFRGGKGVAAGLGTICVLVPGPAAITGLFWIATTTSTRMISAGSMVGVVVLWLSRYFSTPEWFSLPNLATSTYLLVGGAFVLLKHYPNARRMLAGKENLLKDTSMNRSLSRSIHVMALGLWFGSGVMFNLISAPSIFRSFEEVVQTAPNDRTVGIDITANGTAEQKKALSSALAGAAVGPIFPKYFILHAVCAGLALITAYSMRHHGNFRWIIIAAGNLTVWAGWLISGKVADLRLERLSDPSLKEAFAQWHLLSLGLSLLTIVISGIALGFAGNLPSQQQK